mmetsp:Transcript_8278/g.20441  ORF Transcript_8278/g.20441 Transcript_8278/m.20441 type:complete len:214 (+) Transcript_8278:375-1016(+)
MVELVSVLLVPARVEEGHAEGPHATELRVPLLYVAEPPHELLHWHRLLVSEEVLLGCESGLVDEDVGVGGEPRHRARDMVVELVHLLPPAAHRPRVEQLRDHLLLRGQNNPFFAQDPDRRARVGNGFHGILHLQRKKGEAKTERPTHKTERRQGRAHENSWQASEREEGRKEREARSQRTRPQKGNTGAACVPLGSSGRVGIKNKNASTPGPF